MEAHLKAGIKIQPSKTKLFQTETEYFGHRVSLQGGKMVPYYVNKIQEWSVPTSEKEVVTFFRFCGYYRSFIPLYSALTNRMNSMRKTNKFLWTRDKQKDLDFFYKHIQTSVPENHYVLLQIGPRIILLGYYPKTRMEKKSVLAVGAGNAANMNGII